MQVYGLQPTTSGLDATPDWEAKYLAALARNDQLQQAVYNYLTAPTKRTLKELWGALNDGEAGES